MTEVAKNVFEVPGGLYRGSFAYIMNEDAFAELPADLQAALEDKVFGEPLSRAMGAIWDEIDAGGREATAASGDNAVVQASAADMAAYQPIAEGIRKKVIAEVAAKGVDAQAAVDFIAAEMK